MITNYFKLIFIYKMRAITLVFLLVCIAYSQSSTVKTAEEIRSYEKFLRDSVNGQPEPSSDSESDNSNPLWTRSGKFEGDIILNEDQIDALVDEYSGKKNAVTNEARLWPNKLLYYYIKPNDFTSAQIQTIRSALDVVEAATCVKFQQLSSESQPGYVYLQGVANGGCSAAVGYSGSRQSMNLQPNGCIWTGTIIHEFLHSLGFWHMQSTHDRDDYVKINWENIQEGKEHNFNKYTTSQVTNLGSPYDYVSIMHYGPYAFSVSSSRKTIEAHSGQTVGSTDRLTAIDIARIKALYKC